MTTSQDRELGLLIEYGLAPQTYRVRTAMAGGRLRRFTALFAAAVAVLAMPSIASDVVMDYAPPSMAIVGGDPFPECANGITNTETGLKDCPSLTSVRGFDVRVSSYLPGGSVPLVMEWLDLADAILMQLENDMDIRGHFLNGLREAGVSFYLALGPDGQGDPYSRCPPNAACWRSGTRIVEDRIPIDNPSNVNWRSIRHFLIHELAHAYHDIYLEDGFGNKCVLDAYDFSVVRDGLHADVYAGTNHLEYFAQIVSYSLRSVEGSFCDVDEGCGSSMIGNRSRTQGSTGYDSTYPNQVRDVWALYSYDRNGAGLFDAFLNPQGHLDRYFWYQPGGDPLSNRYVAERSRNCDASVWWPE